MKIQLETTSSALLAALGVIIGGALLVRTRAPKPAPVLVPLVRASPEPSPSPVASVASGSVTFSDEFEGNTLSAQKWIDSYPDGVRTHANHEQQYYSPKGYVLRDGKLVFVARRQSMGGMPYTSGMVASYGKFSQKYGRFEIRTKFPKGKGLWPAFWLLPTSKSWPPEIDILELLGHDPTCVYFTNHWRAESGSVPNQQGRLRGPDFSHDFHTFTLVWKPDVLIWSVDGVEQFRTREHVPQEPMYLLANLAVGGDWPGFPDASTPFPSQMEIDYIRVWQL